MIAWEGQENAMSGEMSGTGMNIVRREQLADLRRALRKARRRTASLMSGPHPMNRAAVVVIAAASAVAWLARTKEEKWPPANIDASSWPQALHNALDVVLSSDKGARLADINSAARLLSESLPRRFWLADDILVWVYESCDEGRSARRYKGQYYTPGWLSELLVRLCLKAHSERKRQSKAAPKLRILDPACGSGAFLLAAARILYESQPEAEQLPDATGTPNKADVGDNLFGLDIDPTALALAELSLGFLRFRLHGKFDTTAASLHRRDFLDKRSGLPFNRPSPSHQPNGSTFPLNPASSTKFDVIVGNPPYLGFHHHSPTYRQRVLARYSVFDGKADVFYYFIERGVECLRTGGVLGYVVPRYWLGADKAAPLRGFLARKTELVYLLDFNTVSVFGGRGIQVCVLVLRKEKPNPSHTLRVFRAPSVAKIDGRVSLESLLPSAASAWMSFDVPQQLLADRWVLAPPAERELMRKLEAASDSVLGDVALVSPGLITGADRVRGDGQQASMRAQEGIFVLYKDEVAALKLLPQELALLKPWVKNSQLDRWALRDSGQYVLYIVEKPDPVSMPNLTRHLARFRDILESRYEVGPMNRPWWRLIRPRRPEQFVSATPKILVPFKAEESRFAVDYGRYYCSADVYCINPGDAVLPEYLCCLLNSSLLGFYFRRIAKKMGRLYEYYAHTLVRLPIKVAPMSDQERFKSLHDEIVARVKEARQARLADSQAVSDLERTIDEAVFEIYGIAAQELPPSEIASGKS
ncbi:MAG TPA: N-6 DNA methylase [bacterium]|nr:N-6 DNA methylase [bacterium]